MLSAIILSPFAVVRRRRKLEDINDAPDSLVCLCGRWGVLVDGACRAVTIVNRRGLFRRPGNARRDALQSPMWGMSWQCDGRYCRPPAGWRRFPFELERAPAGGSCRQDSEDDALQPAREPFPAAIHRAHGLHSPVRQVPRRKSRSERSRSAADCVTHGANFRRACRPHLG